MRVIVFSDSHGNLEFARRALREAGQVDFILHAGDHYRDGIKLAAEAGLPVKAVLGNCDSAGGGPVEEFLETAAGLILLVHGHIGGHWFDKLLSRAGECGARAVVFGHTHTAEVVKEGGILLFNPGSISKPRDHSRPSYGILEINGEKIMPKIYRI